LNLDTILTELKSERDRLGRAIAALEGTAVSSTSIRLARAKNGRRGRRHLSAKARRRMSAAQRRRRAKERKAMESAS
jgi:hypothetical protein